ncbi:MAG: SDR family oxidoreductase [Candidatus Nanosalina sp.]
MKNSLEDKFALVTGASSGIGRETVRKLAEEGADVTVASRSEEKLEYLKEEVEDEYDAEALVAPTDVTDEEQVSEMVEKTVDEFGRLDIAVNNAGIGIGDSVEDMDTETYRKMMSVNTDGMFFTAREAIPHLRKADGNLIFLGSFAGKFPRPGNPVYAATKFWTRGFASSLSAQIGEDGIAVTTINPTEVRTEFASESGKSFNERFEKGEVTEARDVAEAIVYAAKQEAPNTVNEMDLYRRDKFSDF